MAVAVAIVLAVVLMSVNIVLFVREQRRLQRIQGPEIDPFMVGAGVEDLGQ